VGIHRAAATALTAVMATGAAVVRAGDDRQPGRNACHVLTIGRPLDDVFPAAGLGRRQENAVGLIAEALIAAEDPDQAIAIIVERRDIVVADRPVIAQAVDRLVLEVVRPEAERHPAPVIGASAHPASPPPVEPAPGSRGEWLAVDVPAADAGIVFAERLLAGAPAAAIGFPGPHQHGGVAGVVPGDSGLEQADPGTGLGQFVGGHAA